MMLARKQTAGSVIRIEVERRFEVSVREGFDHITEPANWPEYWPRFVRLDPGSRWRYRGDRARLTLRMLGRDVEGDTALARREPCRMVEYTSQQRGFPAARHWRRFDDADGDLRLPHHHRVHVPSRMARRARPNARQGGNREKRACTSPSSMLTMATPPDVPRRARRLHGPAVGPPRAHVRRREPPLPSPRSLCRSPRTRKRRTHDAPLATHRVPAQRQSMTGPTQLR